MLELIDSHVHLNDRRFDEDRDRLMADLAETELVYVINPGDTLESSIEAVKLSQNYQMIYAAVGIHPHSAVDYNGEVEASLSQLIEENKKVLAVGEIGLDYYYDHSPRDVQRQVFRQQLDLAAHYQLPVCIHTREAIQDTYDILKEYEGRVRGVMHSYSGSYEMAERFMDLGYYISLSGTVTFKNARVVKEVGRRVPLDRLLIETDSPYLTPEPHRGKRNEPKFVRYVAEEISELKDLALSEVAVATTQNAKDLFLLP